MKKNFYRVVPAVSNLLEEHHTHSRAYPFYGGIYSLQENAEVNLDDINSLVNVLCINSGNERESCPLDAMHNLIALNGSLGMRCFYSAEFIDGSEKHIRLVFFSSNSFLSVADYDSLESEMSKIKDSFDVLNIKMKGAVSHVVDMPIAFMMSKFSADQQEEILNFLCDKISIGHNIIMNNSGVYISFIGKIAD